MVSAQLESPVNGTTRLPDPQNGTDDNEATQPPVTNGKGQPDGIMPSVPTPTEIGGIQGQPKDAPAGQPVKYLTVSIPKEVKLFLNNADEPHICIPNAKGRKVLPVSHRLVRGFAVKYLHHRLGGQLPVRSQVDSLLSLLEAQAFLNGRQDNSDDWRENAIDQEALTLCIFTLAERKAPKGWEATSAEILEAVNLLAAKDHIDKGEGWPKAPHRLSIALEERQLLLEELGVSVTKLARQGTARKWQIKMTQGDATQGDASQEASFHKSITHKELCQECDGSDAIAASLERILAEPTTGTPLTDRQILEWLPEGRNQILANESANAKSLQIVTELLDGHRGNNLLLIGPEGTGKDATTVLNVRTVLCHESIKTTGEPCQSCMNCGGRYGDEREFGRAVKDDQFQFMRIDCANLGSNTLEYEASKVAAFQGRLIVYLHRLDLLKSSRVKSLLKTMKDERFLWFATAERANDVPQEILKQFEVEHTTNPSQSRLAIFLAERCRDWSIKVESGRTLIRLAQVSGQVVGDALKVLARAAATPERTLTIEMVEQHNKVE